MNKSDESRTSDLRICVVSHILPPSPSGQAVVLSRLLSGLPDNSYCLVSRVNYQSAAVDFAVPKLNAPYYCLDQIKIVKLLGKLRSEKIKIIANSLYNIFRLSLQIHRIIKKEKSKVIIACTGDPFDLPAAYLASIYSGVPIIPYIFDDYLYQWTGHYRTLARLFIGRIIKSAVEIIVPNGYLKDEYVKRYGVDPVVIHNPCVMEDLTNLDNHEKLFDDNCINIVYTGSVYHAHYDAFMGLIKAIEILGRSDVRLHIYSSQDEELLTSEGIRGPMLIFHPHVNSSEVPFILRQADILFLPLAFDSPIPEVIKTSAPGKTGEYLAVGKPILVHAPNDSFVSNYFKNNGCGITVGEKDPALLAEALLRLINDQALKDDLGNKARKRAEEDFDVIKARNKFRDILKKCINGR